MPVFSKTSKDRLETCHRDLQMLFNTVILKRDCSILCGFRGEREQQAAFRGGMSKVQWPNSKHNRQPAMAVDVAPYPADWQNRERFVYFAGYVMGVAELLHYEGLMHHRLTWGGDFDGDHNPADGWDLVHFELR